jgi:hypothetical protein
MLNKDFKEFAGLLNSTGVEYLVVGGYALAATSTTSGRTNGPPAERVTWPISKASTILPSLRDRQACMHAARIVLARLAEAATEFGEIFDEAADRRVVDANRHGKQDVPRIDR